MSSGAAVASSSRHKRGIKVMLGDSVDQGWCLLHLAEIVAARVHVSEAATATRNPQLCGQMARWCPSLQHWQDQAKTGSSNPSCLRRGESPLTVSYRSLTWNRTRAGLLSMRPGDAGPPDGWPQPIIEVCGGVRHTLDVTTSTNCTRQSRPCRRARTRVRTTATNPAKTGLQGRSSYAWRLIVEFHARRFGQSAYLTGPAAVARNALR